MTANEVALLDKLLANPSLLEFLVSMGVVAFALFIVYEVIKKSSND
ncbi:MAG: hypothetical protein AB2593_00020 [Candidatus Thiodiazotropha sp.]|nr:hypothetical protein [Candidatus Thiodiazotropha taylori]